MFWYQFWLNNLHFAGELFVAITSLLVVYVLFRVWKRKKERRIALRALGFSIFVLFSAYHLTGDVGSFASLLQLFLKFSALLFIGISFYVEPVQLPPVAPLVFVSGDLLKGGLRVANLALLGAICWRIYLKLTKGFEKELRNLFRGFGLFFASEIVFSLSLFSGTSYVLLSYLIAPFGPVWAVSHLLKFVGFVFIAIWAWGYLRFKLFSQVVGAFVTTSLFIFILMTFAYTSLLVGNMQRSSLENLKINLQTFEYALERLKGETLAQAEIAASNQVVKEAVRAKNKKKLATLSSDFMLSAGASFLVVTDKSGIVLARGEDPEAVGDSLAANLVVSSALEGKKKTNISTREWVAAPQVLIEAAVPIGKWGTIYTGHIVDNAFVDGVKGATGLDVTVFRQDTKAATTLVGPDGVSRLVGAKQANERINTRVLEEGELFLGLSSTFQKEFLSAYGPLKDVEGKILGMLFVGYPSSRLFEAAQNSLNTTFLVSAILALLSFIPAYLLAKYIEEHQV